MHCRTSVSSYQIDNLKQELFEDKKILKVGGNDEQNGQKMHKTHSQGIYFISPYFEAYTKLLIYYVQIYDNGFAPGKIGLTGIRTKWE